MTKEALIERLKNSKYYASQPKGKLIIKLVKGTDEADPDFKQALEDDMAEAILDLYMDCYSDSDFLEWIAKHDFDLFVDYRSADVKTREEMFEDYETEEEFDYLMVNEDETKYVVRW